MSEIHNKSNVLISEQQYSKLKWLIFSSQVSDNGLVQFQSVTENEQYLLPAPFASGFPSDMKLALLAVFWDDADLTQGNGKLHYQVRGSHACD